jgi:hypothetical protein
VTGREHGQAEHVVTFRVDLTDSNLGEGWRSVEIDYAMPLGWSTTRMRMVAADYYGVPLEQVGPVTESSSPDREGAE